MSDKIKSSIFDKAAIRDQNVDTIPLGGLVLKMRGKITMKMVLMALMLEKVKRNILEIVTSENLYLDSIIAVHIEAC